MISVEIKKSVDVSVDKASDNLGVDLQCCCRSQKIR
jgi:hypothetical protein